MNKLIATCMLALFAASAIGQTVDTSKLSPTQIAELAAKANEMSRSPEGVSATVRKEAEAWGDLGANMGKAIVGAAKEVGVAANDFAVTPLGKVTVAIIVYKIVGQDILSVLVGLTMLLVGWTLGIWIFLTKRWSEVTYEYEPVLWGMYKKARIIKISTDDSVVTGKILGGGFLIIASTFVGLVTIF